MDISRLVELQQRLNAALMLWSGAGSHLEKTQRMQDLLDQSLALISGLHGSSHINRDILNWISRNVLSVVNVVLNHMCSLSRADIDGQLYVQKGHILVKMLLIVLQHPSEDHCLRTKVLLCGVLTSWRILFSNSDTNMCSSLASFRRSSLVVGDILELCTGIFSSLERDEHYITMCMILLEILSFSDTPRHRSAVLDCLAHVPPDPVVARIYPGLVSRVVSTLSELRESDFGRAMNVLQSWIPKALACDCSGEACWRRNDANMAKNAHKTSEAIVMVFKKYARIFPSHMTDLSIACLRCACLSQEVIHCIQNHVISILDTDKLLGEARCIVAASSIAFKLSLRSEVTSQLSSCQDPQRTLAIYLGYADLEKHVNGLSQIDPYVVMEMLYRCAEVPPAADGTAFVAVPRLSRCETSVDLADFCEPHEQVFLKAAGDHIGRMPPVQQKQVISDLLDHFIVGVGDTSKVLRLLAVLRGLLSCGSACISSVIPELVEVIMLKVVQSEVSKESHVAALALFATVFRRYQVTLPAHQICDILFWSLPWCMSDCERGYNYARALVYRIAMSHCGDIAVNNHAMLQFYKNLLLHRSIRELKVVPRDCSTCYNVADVVFVLLQYGTCSLKDLFDIIVTLERCLPAEADASVAPMLYIYAFIADYIEKRFDSLGTGVTNRAIGSSLDLTPGIAEDRPAGPRPNGDDTSDVSDKHYMQQIADQTCISQYTTGNQQYDMEFKDRRLAVATVIATRCRYYLSHPDIELRNICLFTLSRCFSSFAHNVPIMRIRLYECWDPLIHCMELNIRSLQVMTHIVGIMTIGTRNAYEFVERWLVDVFNKLCDLVVAEGTGSYVTKADEVHRTIRYKFVVTLLEFTHEVSSRACNRELISRVMVMALLMCKSTAPSVERLTSTVLRELYSQDSATFLSVIAHTNVDYSNGITVEPCELKRDVRRLLPQSARIQALLPPESLSNAVIH